MTIRMLAALGLAALVLPAAADTRSDVMMRAEHCAQVTNGRQWLECYYAAAQPLRAELGLPPAPQAQSFDQLFAQPAPKTFRGQEANVEDDGPSFLGWLVNGNTVKVPPEQFGLKDAKPGPGYNVDRLIVKLQSYELGGGSGFTVTLANGQIWAQLAGDPDAARWSLPAADYTATITHAAFGTYNLMVREKNLNLDTVYKVTRIR